MGTQQAGAQLCTSQHSVSAHNAAFESKQQRRGFTARRGRLCMEGRAQRRGKGDSLCFHLIRCVPTWRTKVLALVVALTSAAHTPRRYGFTCGCGGEAYMSSIREGVWAGLGSWRQAGQRRKVHARTPTRMCCRQGLDLKQGTEVTGLMQDGLGRAIAPGMLPGRWAGAPRPPCEWLHAPRCMQSLVAHTHRRSRRRLPLQEAASARRAPPGWHLPGVVGEQGGDSMGWVDGMRPRAGGAGAAAVGGPASGANPGGLARLGRAPACSSPLPRN